ELVGPEAAELVEDRTVRPLRERPTDVVAEAEVDAEPKPRPPGDPGDRPVEEVGEVDRRVGMDRRRRLVDLDEGRPGGDEGVELGGEDGNEGLGRSGAVAVDLARAGPEATGEGEGTRDRDLERSTRPTHREAVLVDDAEPGRCRDRLDDLEAVLLVVPGG